MSKPLIYDELFDGDGEAKISKYLNKVNEEKNSSELRAYSEKLSLINELEWINVSKKFDLKQRLVLIDFWTYCCINCMHIIPLLNQLENEFDELVVIGVHSSKFANEKSKSNIRSAIKRHLIRHPVVLDFDLTLWNRLEIICWPTLLVVDPRGVVIAEFKGEIQSNLVRAFLTEAFSYYKNELKIGKLITSHEIDIMEEDDRKLDKLSFPTKICISSSMLFVSDSGNNRVLGVDLESGHVKYSIGSGKRGSQDGDFNEAQFDWPQGLAYDEQTNTLYIADTFNDLVRAANLSTRRVSRLCGVGNKLDSLGEYDYIGGKIGLEQAISSPWDVCLVEREMVKILMIACAGTHQIWLYVFPSSSSGSLSWWKNKRIESNTLVCVAGNGKERNKNNAYPMQASFAQPSSLSLGLNDCLYIADAESSTIRILNLKDGCVKAFVGGDPLQPDNLFAYGDCDGIGSEAKFQHPLDAKSYLNRKRSENEFILVADTYNNCLKKIDVKSKKSIKLVSDSTSKSILNEPSGICIDHLNDDRIFIADTNNHSIKIVPQFDINNDHVCIEEFPIRFNNSYFTTPDIHALRIREDASSWLLYASFGFKLNSNAENNWKVLINGSSNAQCGVFTNSDLIASNRSGGGGCGSFVYKFDGISIGKQSDDVNSIQVEFNLVYCENKNDSSKSCKMFKRKFVFNRAQIQKLFSDFLNESFILLRFDDK